MLLMIFLNFRDSNHPRGSVCFSSCLHDSCFFMVLLAVCVSCFLSPVLLFIAVVYLSFFFVVFVVAVMVGELVGGLLVKHMVKKSLQCCGEKAMH